VEVGEVAGVEDFAHYPSEGRFVVAAFEGPVTVVGFPRGGREDLRFAEVGAAGWSAVAGAVDVYDLGCVVGIFGMVDDDAEVEVSVSRIVFVVGGVGIGDADTGGR